MKMALREPHGGESGTTRGDICRSLPAGNELFIDPHNKTEVARDNRQRKTEYSRDAGKEMQNSVLQNKIKIKIKIKKDKLGRIKIAGGRAPSHFTTMLNSHHGTEHVVPQLPAEWRLLSPFTWIRFLVPLHLSHPLKHFRKSALTLKQGTTISYTYELFP